MPHHALSSPLLIYLSDAPLHTESATLFFARARGPTFFFAPPAAFFYSSAASCFQVYSASSSGVSFSASRCDCVPLFCIQTVRFVLVVPLYFLEYRKLVENVSFGCFGSCLIVSDDEVVHCAPHSEQMIEDEVISELNYCLVCTYLNNLIIQSCLILYSLLFIFSLPLGPLLLPLLLSLFFILCFCPQIT